MNNNFSTEQFNGYNNESSDNLYLNEAVVESLGPFNDPAINPENEFDNADVALNNESFQYFDPLDGNVSNEQSVFFQNESGVNWNENEQIEEYEWDDEADDSQVGESFIESFTSYPMNEFDSVQSVDEDENEYILENEFLERSLEKLEAADTSGTPLTAVPPFISEDLSVPGYTCFIKIDLGKANYQMDMTGIYVPASFDPSHPVDLIIYLHGMTGAFPGGNSRINDYWKVTKLPEYDLRLREEINDSGKNVILAAPSLGKSPNSYINNLSGKNGGLDSYAEKVMAAVNTYIVQKRFNAQPINIRNIILAAHSAGGRQMRLITAYNNPVYGQKISECWGFDSLYSSMDGWLSWARKNPGKKLFIYYKYSTANNSNYLNNHSKKLPNIFIKNSTARNHYWVPKHHLKERVMKIGQDNLTKSDFETDIENEAQYFSGETKDWSKAISLNQSYSVSLGWNKFYDQINELLLPFSANQNVSLGEEAFAMAVSEWQKKQGFSDRDSDGIIGPNTWRVMQPQLGSATIPKAPSYIPSYPQPATAPSVQNIFEFNKWHAKKIIDNMNSGVIGQNFDSKKQLEAIVKGETVLYVNPQIKIIQALPVISHISEQARLNNYREIIIGSFIRGKGSDGSCVGHCEGRCIDINHTGGSFETSASAKMVINILEYLTTLPAQYKKGLGFGMPLQGEFFGKKNLVKFKSVSVSNLLNAELRQLVTQLGYVFPDNNNHLHIQLRWM